MKRRPKLIDKWYGALPDAGRHAIDRLVERARDAGLAAYLVGGPVRDLLLGTPSLDADIVIEGDAIALARTLDGEPGVRVVTHPSFGTATLRLSGFTVDVITARRESYARPGALPLVTPSTISDDLARRDFSVNAMALRLTEPGRGELLDPHGGGHDLEARIIRALHERSFQDDATRIQRAARYEARLGFHLEPETEGWMRRDVGFFETISAARVHHELARILAEGEPERALERLQELGALTAIDHALRFERSAAKALRDLRGLAASVPRAASWAVWLWDVPTADTPRLCRRLALTKAQCEATLATPDAQAAARRLGGANLRLSEFVSTLESVPEATLWALAARSSGRVRERVVDYLLRLRRVRPRLRGDDVIALGVPRGPKVGEVLVLLRAARLDGEVRTRRDEQQLVRRFLAGHAR